MDPLIQITGDLHELIFQHLSAREVLSFSEVSKRWHYEVGHSNKCMRKLKLSLKFWRSTAKQQQADEKIAIMENITRQYQNVSIDCRFDKNLSAEFWKLLSFLAPYLMTLKIKSIKLDAPTQIRLPKLEELKIVYVPIDVRNVLVASSNVFKILKLKLVSPLNWNKTSKSDDQSLACIKACMSTNIHLEELEVHGAVQYGFFFDDDYSKDIRFKLRFLKIKNDMRLSLIPEKCEQCLINFLITQSSTLQSIFIDVCRPKVINHIFNNMKVLTSVQIETVMTDYNVKDLSLNLNEHVVNLSIPYITRNNDIREMLQTTPNVNSLFVSHLSHETMEYIAWNLKNLRLLKYRYDEIDCESLYEKLKDENADVNQEIEMVVDYEYS